MRGGYLLTVTLRESLVMMMKFSSDVNVMFCRKIGTLKSVFSIEIKWIKALKPCLTETAVEHL